MSGSTPVICPICGFQRNILENFCGNCGHQFRSSQENHPTISPRNLPQAPITRVLDTIDNSIDDTIPVWSILPQQRNKRRALVLIALTILLIILPLVAVLVGIQVGKGSASVTVNNTPNSSHQVGAGGSTPIPPTALPIPTPTDTPMPLPTPTPTLCSPPPCVLYQAGGSDGWSNWAFSTDWRKVTNGIVISDGGGTPPSAVAPYTVPSGINFAIEAEMMTPNTGSLWWEYGVAACGATQGNQWTGYVGRIAEDYGSPPTSALLTRFGSNGSSDFGQHVFDPGPGWHIFRLEVRGNGVTFKIDGAPVVQATDEEFLQCGNQVGFYDGGGVRREVEVKSFKVIAI